MGHGLLVFWVMVDTAFLLVGRSFWLVGRSVLCFYVRSVLFFFVFVVSIYATE